MFNEKILCIGNETEQTHRQVSILALKAKTLNHGLITSEDFVPSTPGYYHTSITDIASGAIVQNLANHFDLIYMLDQNIDTYSHFKIFVNTFRMMIELEKKKFKTEFRNNIHNKKIVYWYNLLQSNESLCIFPFINCISSFGKLAMCQKNYSPVSTVDAISNWNTDHAFLKIRNDMMNGKKNTNCNMCYDREQLGQASARQFESLEWAINLGLTNIEDLKDIKYPVHYEIRVSNKCNIMCRMCDDQNSHLIAKEYKKIGIISLVPETRWQGFPFDKINFSTARQIHWSGGDPTVHSEFYKFLKYCIKQNTTQFYLTIGTNGLKISDTLLDLLDNFSNVSFSVSFDGYKKVNDYIRWGTNFDQIRNNCFRILERGHKLAFQTVFTMYNATRIHEIYEFYDRDFPGCNALVQVGVLDEKIGYTEPWNHPMREMVLESMYKCKQTRVCFNSGRNTNDLVDEMIVHYENNDFSVEHLKQFFIYNDKLDKSRNSKLEDYIPELAAARSLIR